jgi:Zn-dependent membrane protease YugP
MSAYILIILVMLAGMYVSNQLKKRFEKYSELHLKSNLTGREVAEQMLSDHGINDVKVISVKGALTDHYNPTNKTVNLSDSVYGHRNAAAMAVAAHEVGHAVQHATAYRWLKMRSKLVPVVSFSSRILQWVILGGILLLNTFPQLMLIGIIMFAMTTFFSIITLPVEYDASNRALAWIKTKGIAEKNELDASEDALKWAARTYLVAAISSIASLLYYLMIFMNRRK